MSMAVRERRTEIAVLKTLGFTSGQVMGLVVAEAVAHRGPRAAPSASAAPRDHVAPHPHPGHRGRPRRDRLSELDLQPVGRRPRASRDALFLGFVAGFLPALGAYRARITDMLRTV